MKLFKTKKSIIQNGGNEEDQSTNLKSTTLKSKKDQNNNVVENDENEDDGINIQQSKNNNSHQKSNSVKFSKDNNNESSSQILDATNKQKNPKNQSNSTPQSQSNNKTIISKSTSNSSEDVKLGIDAWRSLGLCDWVGFSSLQMGLKSPSLIQKSIVPQILAGRDVIAAAPTGSGKTAAFALPILHKLSEDPYGPFAVVLTPTRELAHQIGEQFSALGSPIQIRVKVIIGGQGMLGQSLALNKRPHILVATPGRLAEVLEQSGTSMKKVRFVVLDEVDRLLNEPDLREDVMRVMSLFSPTVQILLFSATMRVSNQVLAETLKLKNPFKHWVQTKTLQVVEQLSQYYLFVPDKVKHCYLTYLLRLEQASANDTTISNDFYKLIDSSKTKIQSSIIVFADTCSNVELIFEMLKILDIKCVRLHSQMKQHERLDAVELFKRGTARVLVGTDVASRGLDIPLVDLVINFELPDTSAIYVHRVGRTARAGKPGRSITFVTQSNADKFLKIEHDINKKLGEYPVKESDALVHLNETATAKSMATLKIEEREQRKEKRSEKVENEADVEGEENSTTTNTTTNPTQKTQKRKSNESQSANNKKAKLK